MKILYHNRLDPKPQILS